MLLKNFKRVSHMKQYIQLKWRFSVFIRTFKNIYVFFLSKPIVFVSKLLQILKTCNEKWTRLEIGPSGNNDLCRRFVSILCGLFRISNNRKLSGKTAQCLKRKFFHSWRTYPTRATTIPAEILQNSFLIKQSKANDKTEMLNNFAKFFFYRTSTFIIYNISYLILAYSQRFSINNKIIFILQIMKIKLGKAVEKLTQLLLSYLYRAVSPFYCQQ